MTLRQIVDEILDVMDAQSYDSTYVARKANVCITTMYNLVNGVTKYPRFNTLFKIARALKMEISIDVADPKVKAALQRYYRQQKRSA